MMTIDEPALVADTPEPYVALPAYVPAPVHVSAAQSWNVTVADAKYHWYDLVPSFSIMPDIRDPVGRYLRRMQFDLEATMEKRLLYFVVNRPRVRFDTTRSITWGFFSLKLTIPLLVGAEQKRDSVSMELEVPFAATLKKPIVTVQDRFITLNWGGLIEALSIHDVLQAYDNDLKFPGTVQFVGQTKDPAGRLAKGRLATLQKLQQHNSEDSDTLLLVQRMQFAVDSNEGDPADSPFNKNPVAADKLLKERMDLVECAVIKYFEGDSMRGRSEREMAVRRERLREVQNIHNLRNVHINLQVENAGKYHDLQSATAPASRGHALTCRIDNGFVELVKPASGSKA